MAITIDYSDGVTPEYVIQIPRADMTLVQASPEIRELNINDFRLELADLGDDLDGIHFSTSFFHTPPLTVSGVTLARVVEILTPFVIEFEDGLYNVNVVGGNSNISDRTLKNQVGVNTANSAGLTDLSTIQVDIELVRKLLLNRVVTDPIAGTYTVYDDDDATVYLSGALWEDTGGTIAYRAAGADRRDRLT